MTTHEPGPGPMPGMEPFQIFRRTGLYVAASLLALAAAAAVAAAALLRGPVWLWVPVGLLVALALVAAPGIANGQTPIFVADEHGVRLHERDTWIGMLWSEMGILMVEPRAGLSDPRIRIITRDGRRDYATPVGFTTNVSVADAEVQLARRRAAASY